MRTTCLLIGPLALPILLQAVLARPWRRDTPSIESRGSQVKTVVAEPSITITIHQTVTVSPESDMTTAYFPVHEDVVTLSNTSPSTSVALTTASLTLLEQMGSSTSTTSITSSSSMSAAPSPDRAMSRTNSSTPFLRGVNLGGWLVLEKWMNPNVFIGAFSNAIDQYTFDSIPGSETLLMNHWNNFFTEDDIRIIAATGINALRIPIGFWAYDNADTPYHSGADAFLEKAIGWAKTANMKVWVDLHGSPGSQNGYDNSGHSGLVEWQQTQNLQRSIAVLKTMATKYGSADYADVVVGLEIVNEPISWGSNTFTICQSWARDAYTAVKSVVTNPSLIVVMHDSFQGPNAWTNVATDLKSDKQFGVDSHLYQLFTDQDNSLDQANHIKEACRWGPDLARANAVMPTYVGEWSAATNICVNPDGSTTAGTSCSVSGCQCQSVPFDSWNDNMIQQVRRFVEAQMDVFESSSSGYFIWSAKGPGGWGFLNGIKNGAIPNPIAGRNYPGQCGSWADSA